MPHRLIIDGDLFLYGDVGDLWNDGTGFSARDVLDALAELGDGNINVRINSPGGFVDEGFSIYNALRARGNLTVYVDGLAASAASLIAMASDRRIMREASMLMIHDPAGVTIGPAKDHEKTAELLNKLGNLSARIYARASGMSEEEVRQLMVDETWMDPQDAVELGFATEVLVDSGDSPVAAIKFAYMKYQNTPEAFRVPELQRSLPRNRSAALAAVMLKEVPPMPAKTPAELAAEKAVQDAEKILADAKTEADKTLEAAKALDAEARATAKTAADKITADAKVAAAKIVADAEVAAKDASNKAADVTKQIMSRCSSAKLDLAQTLDIVNKADGSIDKARDLIIDTIAAQREPDGGVIIPAHVTADEREKFVAGATKGLMYRAAMKDGEANEFSGMTMKEFAREVLNRRGNKRMYRDPMAMVLEAFRPQMVGPGYHSTSDFTEVLANVANKSLLKGYEEADETFPLWTSVGTLVDFKPTKRVDLNIFPSLAEVAEGAEYTYGTVGDRGETITLATYGKKFSITRQAIINDDLNVFTRIPQKMGRAARRTVGNLVYVILTDEALLMSDGIALFDATDHANYTASGAAPSVITVQAGIAAMNLQKDPDSIAVGGLNIQPSYLLVPVELKGTANVLMKAINDPAATTPNVPNPISGLLTVVADARLSTKSAKEWYLAANANQYDTIEVAYLNGNQAPTLEQRDGWDVDGVEFKVRLDAAAKALDFRGLYKNNGE